MITFELPEAPATKVLGAIAYEHPSACVTLKCRPATVSVPDRGGPVVGSTVKRIGAEPLPVAPEVIAIQSASDDVVHVHNALDARRSTRPVPPA